MVEVNLIKNAQNGDQEAISEIFEKYKGFVIMKTKNYFLHGADKDDLIQEGMIGLLKAIRAYDSDREASFNTFASLCIKRQIITAIKNSNSNKNKIFKQAAGGFYEGEENNVSYNKKSLIYYNPEEIFLGKEKIEDLKIHLEAELSKMEREVFDYMLLGYDYIEISNKTGRTPKTIDNTIQRVRKKMNNILISYEKLISANKN